METAFYAVWYIMLFVLGTIIFSFLNVVIYRTPLEDTNFAKGRSFCPHCKHTLKAIDLVPLFSWIFLKGKCRYCKAKISARYPIVETLGGILCVACAFKFLDPLNFEWMALGRAACAFLLCCMMTVIAYIDHDTMTIYDSTNIVTAVIGLISIPFFYSEADWLARLIGVFCISLPMYVMVLVKEGAWGGGDIKLFAALGIFFGWKYNLFIFFVSVVVGGIYAMCGLARKTKKRNEHFAFGPFICMAAVITLFFGKMILDWYLGFYS
ncbi:MAG: prepilin peptidase [Lachnospiraceae bacterium]|nr:prepilin peptidase [Lachnospiraceae bacterium]